MNLYNCDNLEFLKSQPDNSIDSIVTDPPYGISFMGKSWDYDVPGVDTWKELMRVLKPGGHIIVACGTRTQHRMVVNIEDAGFEIRDIVAWVYGSGFPKSLNIGKAVDKLQGNEREVVGLKPYTNDKSIQGNSYGKSGYERIRLEETKGNSPYEGWGTALKPAMELWTLARKPLSEKTVAENVLKWGTGGINIDECRVEFDKNNKEDLHAIAQWKRQAKSGVKVFNQEGTARLQEFNQKAPTGRFPANFIHDGSDEVVNMFPNDSQRFFYTAKASKSERNKGLDSYLTVKYSSNICKEENIVAVQLLKRVILDTVQMSFSTGESGEHIMVQCHKDSLSTTLTEIKRIIELRTLNLLMLLLTNESTQDANLEMESGGNLVDYVTNLKKWILTITNEKTELALGANRVALEMLSIISEKENWNQSTNFHSTVKPVALMRYLARLITPKGGVVLDPYMGSGSTGVACMQEGFNFIGVEMDKEYFEIAKARIEHWKGIDL